MISKLINFNSKVCIEHLLKMKKSDFVNVSGVPNLVITYGGWIDDCSASEVVLVIPGKFLCPAHFSHLKGYFYCSLVMVSV